MTRDVVTRWIRIDATCSACGAPMDRLEARDDSADPGDEAYTTGVVGTLRCSSAVCPTRAVGGP